MLRRAPLLVALCVAACASTGRGTERAPIDPVDRRIPGPIADDLPRGGHIVRTSREAGFKELLEDLSGADVVYVGE